MKENASKIAFIGFHLFLRIGTFQWVTGEKIKKFDPRLKLYANRLKRILRSSSRQASPPGAGSIPANGKS